MQVSDCDSVLNQWQTTSGLFLALQLLFFKHTQTPQRWEVYDLSTKTQEPLVIEQFCHPQARESGKIFKDSAEVSTPDRCYPSPSGWHAFLPRPHSRSWGSPPFTSNTLLACRCLSLALCLVKPRLMHRYSVSLSKKQTQEQMKSNDAMKYNVTLNHYCQLDGSPRKETWVLMMGFSSGGRLIMKMVPSHSLGFRCHPSKQGKANKEPALISVTDFGCDVTSHPTLLLSHLCHHYGLETHTVI